MRTLGLFSLLFFCGPVLAQDMTPAERQAGIEASTRYSACINQWMQKLAPSKDPVTNVADAVMAECRDELNKFIVALQPSFRLLSLGEIRESMLKGQKQFITTELVKKRVEPITTGSN